MRTGLQRGTHSRDGMTGVLRPRAGGVVDRRPRGSSLRLPRDLGLGGGLDVSVVCRYFLLGMVSVQSLGHRYKGPGNHSGDVGLPHEVPGICYVHSFESPSRTGLVPRYCTWDLLCTLLVFLHVRCWERKSKETPQNNKWPFCKFAIRHFSNVRLWRGIRWCSSGGVAMAANGSALQVMMSTGACMKEEVRPLGRRCHKWNLDSRGSPRGVGDTSSKLERTLRRVGSSELRPVENVRG